MWVQEDWASVSLGRSRMNDIWLDLCDLASEKKTSNNIRVHRHMTHARSQVTHGVKTHNFNDFGWPGGTWCTYRGEEGMSWLRSFLNVKYGRKCVVVLLKVRSSTNTLCRVGTDLRQRRKGSGGAPASVWMRENDVEFEKELGHRRFWEGWSQERMRRVNGMSNHVCLRWYCVNRHGNSMYH